MKNTVVVHEIESQTELCNICLTLGNINRLSLCCFVTEQELMKILLSRKFKQEIYVGLIIKKAIEFDYMWMIKEQTYFYLPE